MSGYIGYATPKVILRKRVHQYIAPASTDFDMNISDFITGPNAPNVRKTNIEIEPEVGVAYIKPLYANRNNYIVSSSEPESARYKVQVPPGAPSETIQEKSKRVFVSSPTYSQYLRLNGNSSIVGDFVNPYDPIPAGYNGPIWTEEAHESNFTDPSLTRAPYTTWVHQKNSDPNTEWFLSQSYGNFANESFWIDVVKYNAKPPQNIQDPITLNRYVRYGEDHELRSYFAVRIGWDDPIAQEISSNVMNRSDRNTGPYDIVFPIDGAPFIYDHQGEGIPETKEGLVIDRRPKPFEYNGYVADEQTNPIWILKNSEKSFRLHFFIFRSKLIIRASYCPGAAWVFPISQSAKASSTTRERYTNFYVPAGKTCIMGRGFAFRFSYNPLEFDIYNNGRERKIHGNMTLVPLQERTEFEGDRKGGWADIDGKLADDPKCNFTKVPYDKKRLPDNKNIHDEDPIKAYGFDVVSDPYPGCGSAVNSYTSMMISVSESDPKTFTSLVNAYLRGPTEQEDVDPLTVVDYGFKADVKNSATLFKNKFLQVEMNCKAPSYGENTPYKYTNGISKRFASPVLWRLKGKHIVPDPPEGEAYDITRYVKNLSYSSTCSDLTTIRQTFTVQVVVPKGGDKSLNEYNNEADYGSYTREELLELLWGGVREIEIWIGWVWGTEKDPAIESLPKTFSDLDIENVGDTGYKRVRMFTGLARGGPFNQTYPIDTINLTCQDKMEIIQDFPILNSPLYDGMAVDRAFMHICQLSGLPKKMFNVKSKWASQHILPMGFSFMEPVMKFDNNTTILDAIKRIAKMFMHVIRTEPDGTIVLSDISQDTEKDVGATAVIDDLSLTHPSYEFFVNGYNGGTGLRNTFQTLYEDFEIDKNIKEQFNQLNIWTANRQQGGYIADSTAFDVGSIEDPNSKNFIGYYKPARYTSPNLGDEEHVKSFRESLTPHLFQSPIYVKFHTYGRPTIRPLDIIALNLTDKPELEYKSSNYAGKSPNYLQFRVETISGSLDYTDAKWQYRMDIEASHL